MSGAVHGTKPAPSSTKEPAQGRYGTTILALVVIALPVAFYLASRAEPADSRLVDSLADNRPGAEALAVGFLPENPDPVRIATADLRADRRLLAEEMGVSSILVRDGLVWFEYETDTAMPWIRVNEPTKSLVFTSGSPVPYAAATLDDTFDYNFDLDPGPGSFGAGLLVCRHSMQAGRSAWIETAKGSLATRFWPNAMTDLGWMLLLRESGWKLVRGPRDRRV